MGDEQDQDTQRLPLWPPDNPPPPQESAPANSPAIPPADPPAPPTAAPSYGGLPDDAAALSGAPVTSEAPGAYALPNGQSDAAEQAARKTSPFAPAPRLSAPPAPAPPAPPTAPSAPSPVGPTARRKGLSWGWRLGLTLLVCALLLAGAVGLYSYASSLAAQPQRIMTNYCAALIHDNYRSVYNLLSSSAQAQETETRYLSDASARDTISGRVTKCAASPTQNLSPLSFLRSPRSLIFNATITRKQAANGQIALTRDASGWHVAALSSSLQGIDLGPLYTEQALCTAFAQRAYNQAYALLSTPFQKEQGDATTFARAFGATLIVTGCAPDLKSYSVNHADQQATLDATLALSVTPNGGGAASAFSLPAHLSFVREATGWRVDAITPQLAQ